MTLAGPVGRADAPLARRNPVAKLAAALVFSMPLIGSIVPAYERL